jgi:hypothetical protein
MSVEFPIHMLQSVHNIREKWRIYYLHKIFDKTKTEVSQYYQNGPEKIFSPQICNKIMLIKVWLWT